MNWEAQFESMMESSQLDPETMSDLEVVYVAETGDESAFGCNWISLLIATFPRILSRVSQSTSNTHRWRMGRSASMAICRFRGEPYLGYLDESGSISRRGVLFYHSTSCTQFEAWQRSTSLCRHRS